MNEEHAEDIQQPEGLSLPAAGAAFAAAAYLTWALFIGDWALDGIGILGTTGVVLFVALVVGRVLSGVVSSLKVMSTPHPAELEGDDV